MKIVADANIPFVEEAFSDVGDVTPVSGRLLTPDQLRDADILLVRSVTQVNQKLLDNSNVKDPAYVHTSIYRSRCWMAP